MKLTDRQLKLFKLHLCRWLGHDYNSKLDTDELYTIMGIDDATIEEQIKNRSTAVSYPKDSKSYIISVRVCDQADHNNGRLMKFFVTSIKFDPYPIPETIIDMKLLSNMVYKLEK